MELMERMTEKQNRDIEARVGNRLDDVKKEMTGAIQTVADRQDNMEREQQSMKEQMLEMKEQMIDMKKVADIPKAAKNLPSIVEVVQRTGPTAATNGISVENQRMLPVGDDKEGEKKRIEELIDISRRTISLHPFDQNDIDFELKRGAENENEAKLWAVQTFLRYEMNIKSHIQETFSIVNIFSPAGNSWDRIYVTFSSVTAVNTIFSFTRNMRKEVTVDIYVPPECNARYRAVKSIAYKERCPAGVKENQTRIKWGDTDFTLFKKALGTRYWSVVIIGKPLPPVDFNAVEVEVTHHSPAPGRQSRGRDKRSRSNGSGSEREQSLSKNRKVDERGGTDTGRVIEEESYCPASPAPAKKGPLLHIDSPVFTKNKTPHFSPVPSRMNPLIL